MRPDHSVGHGGSAGGEWGTLFLIGAVAGAQTSFYQPLDWGRRWFVEPSLRYERGTQVICFDGTAIAEYRFRSPAARLEAGKASFDEDSPSRGNMLEGLSVFVGGNTLIGPVIFA